jgi:hypothetical protein
MVGGEDREGLTWLEERIKKLCNVVGGEDKETV